MPEVHPAIAKKIEELFAKARELIGTQQQNLDILSKTIDIKDGYGFKVRAEELADVSDKIHSIAIQLDALRSIPYDMAAENMVPKRRTSTQIAAMIPSDKGDKHGDSEE